jgi:hypothetical protein
MASFKAKPLARPLVSCSLLLTFAAMSSLGTALGQTQSGSPIVADLPVSSGTERVIFLGTQGARALLVFLPGSDGVVGLDSAGGIHKLGGNFLVRTISQWSAQGFDVVLPDAPNGTSLFGQRHLPAYADAISKAIDFGLRDLGVHALAGLHRTGRCARCGTHGRNSTIARTRAVESVVAGFNLKAVGG